MRKVFLIFSIVLLFVLAMSSIGYSGDDTKDWKLVTGIGVLMEKSGADGDFSKALVLTMEYDNHVNDDSLLYAGVDVKFAFEDKETSIKPFVGVEYYISDVTTVEARIDYDTKSKDTTLLVRMIFTW